MNIGYLTYKLGAFHLLRLTAESHNVKDTNTHKQWTANFETGMLKKTFWAFMLIFFFTACNALAWQGKVADKETGQPIEGVVVVRAWVREIATPAGSVTRFLGMKETLTDEKGKFSILRKFFLPGMPILTMVLEEKPVVYKPGYKFVILEEKTSVIELEKIPTFINLRKEEVYKAESNYEVDRYETKIFMDVISKEEEFIQSLKYPIKTAPMSVAPQKPARGLITSDSSGSGLVLVIPQGEGAEKVVVKERKSSIAPKADKVPDNIRVLEDHSINALSRGSAASSLGYYNDPRAVPSLINALKDDSPVVRYQAAAALGKMKDSRAVPSLINALKDDSPVVRDYAAAALGKMKDPRAVLPFIDALSDEYLGVRREAIVALGEMKDSRAVPFLINALWDKDKGIRFEAATVLGKFNDPRAADAVEPLIRDLGSKDINIQSSASYALVQIGKPSVELLIKALRDNDKTIRREAALALAGIGDNRAIEPLIELLNSNEYGVSWAAATALGNFNDHRTAKALINALRFKDGNLRSGLSGSLVRIKSISVDYLIAALNDEDAAVREQAGFILGHIKDSKSVEPLMKALKDEDSRVRRSTSIALGLHKDSRAVNSLISAWNDTDSEVRTKASEALISIGSAASEQLLVELKNKNSYIRWRAAWCLGRIKDQAAVDALTVLLNDKTTEVQWIAIDALSEIGNKRAYEALAKLCNTKDKGIRKKAESALIELTGNNICFEKKLTP